MTLIKEYLEASEKGVIKGIKCESCGHVQVTIAEVCPKSYSAHLSAKEFSGEGKVVCYTIIEVLPELFMDYAPYAFVVVELEEGARCTGWMPYVKRPEEIRIGDRVRFVRTYKPGMVFEKVES